MLCTYDFAFLTLSCHVLQLETLSEDQLVSEEEKAALHARWLASTESKKRKKPSSGTDAVQLEGIPVVTSR